MSTLYRLHLLSMQIDVVGAQTLRRKKRRVRPITNHLAAPNYPFYLSKVFQHRVGDDSAP